MRREMVSSPHRCPYRDEARSRWRWRWSGSGYSAQAALRPNAGRRSIPRAGRRSTTGPARAPARRGPDGPRVRRGHRSASGIVGAARAHRASTARASYSRRGAEPACAAENGGRDRVRAPRGTARRGARGRHPLVAGARGPLCGGRLGGRSARPPPRSGEPPGQAAPSRVSAARLSAREAAASRARSRFACGGNVLPCVRCRKPILAGARREFLC